MGSLNRTQTCPLGDVGGRLKSFGAGCKNVPHEKAVKTAKNDRKYESSGDSLAADPLDSGNLAVGAVGAVGGREPPLSVTPTYDLEQVVDVTLITQAYTYGRYLLYSAAAHTPINLQGIWTDGPTSSWNGACNTEYMF